MRAVLARVCSGRDRLTVTTKTCVVHLGQDQKSCVGRQQIRLTRTPALRLLPMLVKVGDAARRKSASKEGCIVREAPRRSFALTRESPTRVPFTATPQICSDCCGAVPAREQGRRFVFASNTYDFEGGGWTRINGLGIMSPSGQLGCQKWVRSILSVLQPQTQSELYRRDRTVRF